ncbi:MAG: DUF1616 domain-containing protein, partial [Chloroflexota bacterium]|nr:DUF1616 domain-containing protein [Chloroflexota bacterium]
MMATGRHAPAMWQMELWAALALALLAWADGPIVLRLPLGLVAVMLLPGYALTMLLFASGELCYVERLGLSLALSFAVLAVLAILLNATPWGFGYAPIVAAVTGWTTLALVGAWIRSTRQEAQP